MKIRFLYLVVEKIFEEIQDNIWSILLVLTMMRFLQPGMILIYLALCATSVQQLFTIISDDVIESRSLQSLIIGW